MNYKIQSLRGERKRGSPVKHSFSTTHDLQGNARQETVISIASG